MSDKPNAWVSWLSLLLRLALGALFVVAGVMKLRDPTRFALEISNYQLIPWGTATLAAVLPPMEIVAAVGLVVLPQLWRRAAALLIIAMTLVFTGAVSFAYFRGVNIDCGCFGGAEGPITAWTLVRNASLLLAGVLILLLETRAADKARRGGRLPV